MDGVVKVKSKVGKGSTFKIELIVLCTLHNKVMESAKEEMELIPSDLPKL